MKTPIFALTLACLGFGPGALAGNPLAPPAPRPPGPQWRVRVEVLMVAMPQEQFFALLPDLRDPGKIEATLPRIFAAIARKEALLTGYPMVQTSEGQRTQSETVIEKRFPGGYLAPLYPKKWPGPDYREWPSPPIPELFAGYEMKNVGPVLEVTGTQVDNDGGRLQFSLRLNHVESLDADRFPLGVTSRGRQLEITQPQFQTGGTASTLSVKNGEYVLFGVQTLTKPEGFIEVSIVQATATPYADPTHSPRPDENSTHMRPHPLP